MSFEQGIRWWRPVAMTMLAVACQDAVSPEAVASPDTFLVEPLAVDAIRLEWAPVSDENVVGYRIERRANLSGAFETIVENAPQVASDVKAVHIDTELEPETFYGYRLVTLTRFGQASAPSVVRAAKTPPMPGIQVRTNTTLATAASADADGYRITIAGNGDTITAPLAIQATRRFNPLATGNYSVALRGMAGNCASLADTIRTANVVNDGVHTIDTLQFDVNCRDPNRGQIVVEMLVKGDSLPPRPSEGSIWRFGVSGEPQDGDTTIVVSEQRGINQPSGGNLTFDNLLPASYEVELIKQTHHAHCVIDAPAPNTEGKLVVFSQAAPLSSDTVRFAATCNATGSGGGEDRPYRWRNVWRPNPIMPGEQVELDIILDVTADPEQTIESIQAQVRYDTDFLDYQQYVGGSSDFESPNVHEFSPGEVNLLPVHNLGLPALTGEIRVATLMFQVLGDEGDVVETDTEIGVISERQGSEFGPIDLELVGVDEATLTISGTALPNEPPTADAGGPYTVQVNTNLTLDGSGSTDSDGSVVQYSWDFGDGSSGSGMRPVHSYEQVGSYTLTLTVTDNDGAAATDESEVTVNPVEPKPPVARANGPYSGEPNQAIQFSAAGSSDEDGTITGYSWTFGDGSSEVTEQNPQHTFADEGDYAARLTVTDNDGLTGFEDATVRIRASGGSTPFALTGSFSTAGGQVFLTLSLDLTEDIDETPVAEALRSWRINTISFDPSVLEYDGFTVPGSVSYSAGSPGVLRDLAGLDRPAGQTGVVTLQRLRFNVVGAMGANTMFTIDLESLIGTETTGDYDYVPMTEVIAPVFTVP